MSRADLLALSGDDLAALTNSGTVKRAQREVETGECTCQLDEADDGSLTAKWSDGARCFLPAGAVLTEGRCSCVAVGLCRHLVRTVLAYQRQSSQGTAAVYDRMRRAQRSAAGSNRLTSTILSAGTFARRAASRIASGVGAS